MSRPSALNSPLESPLDRAADIAATAALLQIGAELGVDQMLDVGAVFGINELARHTDLPAPGLKEYLTALVAAGLVVETGAAGQYRPADDYADRRYEAGYVSWSVGANYPFIENARSFLSDRDGAGRVHHRDGRRVAVSSRWVGERGFYQGVYEHVRASGARRITDLGAGAGRLLIKLLLEDPARTGVALDISGAACAAAKEAAVQAGVEDRLEVTERPIESLMDDLSPVDGADAVQACFVMHDVVEDDTVFRKVLAGCREGLAPGGCMAVVDAVSYAPGTERKFSALFTYLHANFMDIRLPAEREWLQKFEAAGFSSVTSVPQPMPGSRLFIAAK
ncbi:methyltransferase type 12 [Streptomyces camponoticapitis]|uniref:Methyltransferase type 12 n=1 Tax=Streptomyces camponoticapitis TaxID=1616125 RepID=A0ABQ2EXM0_9ACTN|nr:methyltransferase [Streptomyces camponoticapitis]GGK29925.1 methyltransferase type 12 [Streptomyces camponoticapitis]